MNNLRAALDDILSLLDELADNGEPGKRKAQNPILLGNSGKFYAAKLREALAAAPPADARDHLAAWMMLNSFATVHGDTIEHLVVELLPQVEARLSSGLVAPDTKSDGGSQACAQVAESEILDTAGASRQSAVKSRPSDSTPAQERREEIARIIDPRAFEDLGDIWAFNMKSRRDEAARKADRILALPPPKGEPRQERREEPDVLHKKSDIELARFINLALLMCDGISEVDAGFDLMTTINDAGLKKIAEIIGRIRALPPPKGEPSQEWNSAIDAAAKLTEQSRCRMVLGGNAVATVHEVEIKIREAFGTIAGHIRALRREPGGR